MYIHTYSYMYVRGEVCVPRQKPNQHGAIYFISFSFLNFLFSSDYCGGGRRRDRQRGRERQRRNECTHVSREVLCVWYMHMCMFWYTLEWRPTKDMLYHSRLLLKAGSLTSQRALENLLSLSSKITEIAGGGGGTRL